MGAPTFADKVLQVFMDHPNTEVSVSQIIREAGNRPSDGQPYNSGQIQSAISNLRNRGQVPIEMVVAGKVYRYTPGAKAPKNGSDAQLFELVATLKNGAVLLQNEGGAIFRAVELS